MRTSMLCAAALIALIGCDAPKDAGGSATPPPPTEAPDTAAATPQSPTEAETPADTEGERFSQELVLRLDVKRVSTKGREPSRDHQRFTLEGSTLRWRQERTQKPLEEGERALDAAQRDTLEELVRALELTEDFQDVRDASGEDVLHRAQITLEVELEGARHQTALAGALYRSGGNDEDALSRSPRFRDVMQLFTHLKRLQP